MQRYRNTAPATVCACNVLVRRSSGHCRIGLTCRTAAAVLFTAFLTCFSALVGSAAAGGRGLHRTVEPLTTHIVVFVTCTYGVAHDIQRAYAWVD